MQASFNVKMMLTNSDNIDTLREQKMSYFNLNFKDELILSYIMHFKVFDY